LSKYYGTEVGGAVVAVGRLFASLPRTRRHVRLQARQGLLWHFVFIFGR